MKKTLTSYYNSRHALGAKPASFKKYAYKGNPTNRYEVCIRYFIDCFQGHNILELASGGGALARSLIASGLDLKGYTVSDVSKSRLKSLKLSFTNPIVRVVYLDAENIPEEEYGSYDAVIMIHIIEHLIDPLGAMQQIRNLLKPGGFAYIETPNIAKYTRRIKLLFGRFPGTATQNEGLTTHHGNSVDLHEEGHLHYFTYRSLSLMLTEYCGFSRVEKLGYWPGRKLFGERIDNRAARLWPEMFSDVILVGYT